ncbi:unnamed protein product [Acanthoscelides obtectus]|uniref:UDP-glucuronosyltransferase n=1 Tax=Acanthoscelides obtectus TaxID=200917 RepID=A0A9P0LCR4_ACAOB|nr:unnamed protein product [Acanthoscelides obtectus]CAK1637615.1 Ecdysteroid UDP-glucosyltransferase [Acanthoscelides obtectus]
MWLITFLSLLALTSGARILGLVPTPSYSHQTALWPIWKKLASRGHKVTLITANPINDPKLSNLTEINIRETYKIWTPMYKNMKALHDPFKINDVILPTLLAVSEYIFDNEEVKALTRNDTTFDIVIVETMFPEMLIFGEIFKCPTVCLSSMGGAIRVHESIGNSVHPVVYPELMLPYYKDLTFKERITSVLYYLAYKFRFEPQSLNVKNNALKKYFGENAPSITQLLDKVSMTFLDVHPALDGARPIGPNTVNFGGMVHIRDPQPLPKDLKEFLDASKEGVVYFSLGSNVKSANLKQEEFEAIIQALSDLPYKVLWKYESDDIPNKPKNVKFVKWTPQQDVLRHPNIRAFVTQAGLQSLEEAIYFHVPIVMLPFCADQEQNAKKAELRKIGKTIYPMKDGITKDALKNSIKDVIEDPSYRKNIKSLAEIMLDEPMSGVDKVIWWTEYVIRHKGARHFRNHILDIPLYQYFMLDILAFSISVLTILLVLVWITYRMIRNRVSAIVSARIKEE